jgi:hypothetical protein
MRFLRFLPFAHLKVSPVPPFRYCFIYTHISDLLCPNRFWKKFVRHLVTPKYPPLHDSFSHENKEAGGKSLHLFILTVKLNA